MDVIELIANGPPNLQERLETALSTIQSDKDTLRSLMKENFLLHHDVVHLDEQIKMLIKNRITVEEIAHKFSHLMPSVEDSDIVRATLDQEQQILYGQLFYELQHKPIYLVRAARCATGSKASAFTNTVLLSIFGDQYDNHEEHMLLVMLR
jgi:Ras GTPase-activating-like protein IQGAP2/3